MYNRNRFQILIPIFFENIKLSISILIARSHLLESQLFDICRAVVDDSDTNAQRFTSNGKILGQQGNHGYRPCAKQTNCLCDLLFQRRGITAVCRRQRHILDNRKRNHMTFVKGPGSLYKHTQLVLDAAMDALEARGELATQRHAEVESVLAGRQL